jgi:dTMP kinase
MSAMQLAKGLFITFEGGEGSGKSTQVELLAKNLRSSSLPVLVTREPGGSKAAEIVREVLLSGLAERHGAEVEAILFSAARRDHVDTVIRPAMKAGTTVLCDRFMDSTRAYQGAAGALPETFIRGLESVAVDGLKPDLTFLLDIPASVGLERAARRRSAGNVADRFEKETLQIHEDRRQAYHAIAVKEPERFILIPANREQNVIADEIALVVRTHVAAHMLREDTKA